MMMMMMMMMYDSFAIRSALVPQVITTLSHVEWRGSESDSRPKDPWFEPRQGAQDKIVRVFQSQKCNVVLTRCRCAQPLCVYGTHKNDLYAR